MQVWTTVVASTSAPCRSAILSEGQTAGVTRPRTRHRLHREPEVEPAPEDAALPHGVGALGVHREGGVAAVDHNVAVVAGPGALAAGDPRGDPDARRCEGDARGHP